MTAVAHAASAERTMPKRRRRTRDRERRLCSFAAQGDCLADLAAGQRLRPGRRAWSLSARKPGLAAPAPHGPSSPQGSPSSLESGRESGLRGRRALSPISAVRHICPSSFRLPCACGTGVRRLSCRARSGGVSQLHAVLAAANRLAAQRRHHRGGTLGRHLRH